MEALNLALDPAARARQSGRSRRTIYWVATGIFAALMALDGASGLARVEAGQEVMRHLGYPLYILSIIGAAKLLGAAALLQPWFRTVKEWAYAGFVINFIGAAASWLFVDGRLAGIVPPVVALTVLLGTYWLWKRQTQPE
jgi:DoxX-like family